MKMELLRLDHYNISAPLGSEEKIRWFYGTVLELKEMNRPGNLDESYASIRFKTFDFYIHIALSDKFVKPPEDFVNYRLRGNHLAIEVKNIAHIRNKFNEANVRMILNAAPIPNCERIFAFDPFGNCFEFLEFEPTKPRL